MKWEFLLQEKRLEEKLRKKGRYVMKVLNLILLCSLALSGCTAFANPGVKEFLQKHKGKLKAGVAAAAAIGLAIALTKHAGKTMKALEKAKIDSNNPWYGITLAFVGAFGPLGKDNMNKVFNAAEKVGLISSEYRTDILCHSPVGPALAAYWDKGTIQSTFGCVGAILHEISNNVKKTTRSFIDYAENFFK